MFFARSDLCPTDITGKARTVDYNQDANHVTLYVSTDGRSFQEVCLPTELKDASYKMVSAHDGKTAFILGDHYDGMNPVSNLCEQSLLLRSRDTPATLFISICRSTVSVPCSYNKFFAARVAQQY